MGALILKHRIKQALPAFDSSEAEIALGKKNAVIRWYEFAFLLFRRMNSLSVEKCEEFGNFIDRRLLVCPAIDFRTRLTKTFPVVAKL